MPSEVIDLWSVGCTVEAGGGLYICLGVLEMEKSGVESMKHSVMAVPSTHLPLTFLCPESMAIWEH